MSIHVVYQTTQIPHKSKIRPLTFENSWARACIQTVQKNVI